MANLDLNNATTTDLTNAVDDYEVDSVSLDYVGGDEETYWYFSDATTNIGYYQSIPELKSAIDSLALWSAGLGWTADSRTKVQLDNIIGWGEDSFQSICQNLIRVKKVCGDSFAEIMTSKNGTLINLKPISPERMRLVVSPNGMLKRYDYRQSDGKYKPMKLHKILHLCNDRFADEIHGMSVVPTLKWVIDALHEALSDERMIKHRELAMGVLYVDSDDTTKRDALIKQYEDAIKKGEVLVLPKDVAELKDNPVTPQFRIDWIKFLQSYFYQVVGTPKIIATSEDYTEAGGKVGFLTFEPKYTNESSQLETDLWNQLAKKVKFNRPPSLNNNINQDEQKNTSQTGFQPNDTTAGVGE